MLSRFRSVDRRLAGLPICGVVLIAAVLGARAAEAPPHSAELDRMIREQAKKNNVPETLVRRIVMRESKYDPSARNHKYWGLMQISYPTARSMGFKGAPHELLDPLVNLTYAVPYLANAFVIAGKHEDEAVRLYASGYYWTARKRGLLGVLHGADPSDIPPTQVASIEPVPTQAGVYGSLPPTPQMVAVAPVPAAPPSAMDLDAAKGATDLVAENDGTMHPPRKWRHDGGVTEIARGDQGLDNVVAYAGAKTSAARKTARRSRKSTEFASIDMPAAAQAYAADAAQDPRLAQAPSQAAIAMATAPQAVAVQEVRPTTFYAQGTVGEPQTAPPPAPSAAQQAAVADAASSGASAPKPERASRHAHQHAHEKAATKVARHGKTQAVAAAEERPDAPKAAPAPAADAPVLRQ